MWGSICEEVASCTASTNNQSSLAEAIENVAALKTLSAVDIWFNVAGFMPMPFGASSFGPLPMDGVFFTEDPRDRIYQNNVPTSVPYFITVNSYEGTLMTEESFPNGFYFEQLEFGINLIFAANKSVDVIGKRDEWLNAYNSAIGIDGDISDLSEEQKFTLGTIMYGDVLFRETALDEAKAYATAGAPVYTLYFDMETKIDILTFAETCCGVAHGSELLYTFGYKSDPNLAFLGQAAWNQAVTDYIGDQISSIVKTGKHQYTVGVRATCSFYFST